MNEGVGVILYSFGPLKLSDSRSCVSQELLFTHWASFSPYVERKVLHISLWQNCEIFRSQKEETDIVPGRGDQGSE